MHESETVEIAPQVQDAWQWVAHYVDGETLPEYDAGHPTGRGWKDVDLTRVAYVVLQSQMPHLAHHVLKLPVGAEPVFLRRRVIGLDPVTDQETSRATITLLGWRRGDKESFVFYFEDGSSLISDDLNAV